MNGKQDDIALFNGVLGDADVIKLYNYGSPPNISAISWSGSQTLEAWWRFEDNLLDSGPNGYHLTMAGDTQFATTSSGGRSTSVTSAGRLRTTANLPVGASSEMTQSIWVKPSSTMTGSGFTGGFGHYVNGIGVFFYNNAVNKVTYFAVSADGGNYISGGDFYSSEGIPHDEWGHIVMTKKVNGTASTWKLYLNGEQLDIYKSSNRTNTYFGSEVTYNHITGSTMNFGMFGGFANGEFKGKMDNPIVHSTALTDAEVKELYNGGYVVDPLTLSTAASVLAWWPLDGTYLDATGNGYNLALESGTVAYDSDVPYLKDSSVNFDATNKSLFVNSNIAGTSADTWQHTVTCWFKPTANGWSHITNISTATGSNNIVEYQSAFRVTNTGRLLVGGASGSFDVGPLVTVNEWQHIAYTRTGTNSIKYYLNGNVSTYTQIESVAGVINQFGIAVPWGAEQYGNGRIDNVTYHSSVLSDAQIAAIYNAGSSDVNVLSLDSAGSLEGWWDMNGDFLDRSGNRRHLHVNGAVEMSYPVSFNKSIVFSNNEPNYLAATTSDPALSDLDKNFTVSAWVKSTDGNYMAVSWGNPSAGKTRQMYIYSTTSYMVEFYGGGTACTTSTTIGDGKWHNIISTLSNDYKVNTYIDGVQVSVDKTITTSTVVAPPSGGSFWIGRAHYNGHYMTGSISDVSIHSRVLTKDECLEMYNNGTPRDLLTLLTAPDIFGYWRFNGDFTDSGPNGFDLAIANSGISPPAVYSSDIPY